MTVLKQKKVEDGVIQVEHVADDVYNITFNNEILFSMSYRGYKSLMEEGWELDAVMSMFYNSYHENKEFLEFTETIDWG